MSRDANRVRLVGRPHRRYNALTGDWIFVSPQRTQRPWQGKVETGPPLMPPPAHDPLCYLCPGNVRASGDRNPDYESTHVFTNDFPAFLPDAGSFDVSLGPLMRAQMQRGVCRVICYTPRHDLTMARMSERQIREVIDTWAAQIEELEAHWRWVQIFENQGALMGASNPHPHGQIWAGNFIPNEMTKELTQQREWMRAHGSPLLINYAEQELAARERLVAQNAHWLVVVPWWAVWPFETLLLPRRHVSRLSDLKMGERDALAEILRRLLVAYDGLFDVSFPYSFGWHGAPAVRSGDEDPESRAAQLHAHFYPPLLRSATVRKFMVGYEMLAEGQRDISPEEAAARIQSKLAES